MKDLEQTTERAKSILEYERVLVVDDFEKWLNVATNNLVHYGCKKENIFLAKNILEGKRVYSLEQPQMVISDINFDGDNPKNKDGLEFLSFVENAYIKKNSFSQRGWFCELIAMSSLDPSIKREAIDAGANYFINKENFTDDWDFFINQLVKKRDALGEWVTKGTGPIAEMKEYRQ